MNASALENSVEELLRDPSVSQWLKAALPTVLARDPADALNDALLLAGVLEARLRAVLELEDVS